MFAACRPYLSTMVDMRTVDSIQESQRLRSASGRLFGGESTAALVVSGRLFGRESAAALFNKSDGSGYLETVQVC